jgi:hypothetical protein
VTGSIDELNWALAKYAHDDEIGKHFFDIKYDYTHFHTGAPKALTQRGFTLQNIMDCGGVCADQAYFAMEIGKAIGVPTAYASGASSNGSHAWVGFLQSNGRRGWWNFSSGRYDAYKGVKGRVMDPQTRQGISDSDVSLLAEIIDTKPLDRQTAVALVDAANRLLELEKNGTLPTIPDGAPDGLRKTPRPANYTAALAMIDSALKQYDGYAPAWFAIRDLATADRLSKVERRRWAERVIELGSIRYPDFTLNVVGPMIASVDDVKEQDQLWKNAFTIFQKRFDLAADIRMQQGAMWEAAKQPAKARECNQDVINRYANAGPFIRDALLAMERLIDESGKSGDVLKLYEVTWQHITPPKERNRNFAQSNWYQVGMRYVQKLTEAGDAAKARTVEDQIKEAAAPAAKG